MKILEKKNVQINFTESLLRMAADDVEGEHLRGGGASSHVTVFAGAPLRRWTSTPEGSGREVIE